MKPNLNPKINELCIMRYPTLVALCLLFMVSLLPLGAFAQKRGLDVFSIEQRRLTVGLNDDNGDGKPDYPLNPSILATYGLRNENIMITCDMMEFTVKAEICGAGSYNYIYLIDYITFYSWIVPDGYTVYSAILKHNGVPSAVNALRKTTFYAPEYVIKDINGQLYPYAYGWQLSLPSGSFTAGDTLELRLHYYNQGTTEENTRLFELYVSNTNLPTMATMVNPPTGDKIADNVNDYAGPVTINAYDPFATDQGQHGNNYLIVYGPGTFTQVGGWFEWNDLPKNTFPYEYRPVHIIDSLEVTVPWGWELSNSQTFTLVAYNADGSARTCTIVLTATPETQAEPNYKVFDFTGIWDINGNLSGSVAPFVPPSGYFYFEQERFEVTPRSPSGYYEAGNTMLYMTPQPACASDWYGTPPIFTIGWDNYYLYQYYGYINDDPCSFTVDAGSDQVDCNTIFYLDAQPLDYGNEWGFWSVVSGDMYIYDPFDPQSGVELYSGSATLQWNLYTNDCFTSGTVALVSYYNLLDRQWIEQSTSGLCIGGSMTLTNASSNLAYWYSSNPSIATVSGSGSSVTVTAVSAGWAPIVCVFSNGTCTDYVSTSIQVSPPVAATISSAATCSGSPATFTAAVSSGNIGSMSYQWIIEGNTYTTSSSSYVRPVSTISTYTVKVTNQYGCTGGFLAPQTVTPIMPSAPTIAIQSSPGSICLGQQVTCSIVPGSVTHQGTAPKYQWKRNGAIIPYGTGTSCTITPLLGDEITCTLTSNATYCLAPNPKISAPLVLTINPTTSPDGMVTVTPLP